MAVMTCELKPGEQVPQNELMEKHGTSATPIREALMRLVQQGLVEAIPRFGYIVSRVTLSDVHQIYERRVILEAAAARLAAALSERDADKTEEVVTAQITTSMGRVMQALTQKYGIGSEHSPFGGVHIHP